jgi:hypothetical protein
MTMRTTSRMVTFIHPFNLSGMDKEQPAGTYTVETDEELLQTLSLPAYKRISTLIRLPARPRSTMVTQIVEINPQELAAALTRDAQPDETIPQLTGGASVVRRKNTASRMEIIREGWQHWGLFTSWLMRG